MSLNNYLAWVYTMTKTGILYISQQQYITSLVKIFQKYGISEFRTPMDERQHYSKSQMPTAGSAEALQMATLPYRELIGSLLWVSNGTWPDVTYQVNTLTKFTSNPALIYWRAALIILGFLNVTKNYCIRYTQQLHMDTIAPVDLWEVYFPTMLILTVMLMPVMLAILYTTQHHRLYFLYLWGSGLMAKSHANICSPIQHGSGIHGS